MHAELSCKYSVKNSFLHYSTSSDFFSCLALIQEAISLEGLRQCCCRCCIQSHTPGERVYTLTSCYAQATYPKSCILLCPSAELLSDSEYAIHNSIASDNRIQYQYYKYIEFFSVPETISVLFTDHMVTLSTVNCRIKLM